MGSLESVATDSLLAAPILCTLLLMPADGAVHRRKDRLYTHAILGCVPPDYEAKMGATLVRQLLEVASGGWNFTSFAPKALPRGAGDGIPT